jgi:hypothetical protein
VAKTLGATAHLSIFCSSGEQPNRDARWHIQEDFKKALRVSRLTAPPYPLVSKDTQLTKGSSEASPS